MFKVFWGIQNKPDGWHPTEPHTKQLSANERSHGNDDGAWIPFKCTRLPLWCEWKTSAPGGCSLTQGKLKWKSATGDYYNRSWPLAFHICRWERICFGFDSYLRFKHLSFPWEYIIEQWMKNRRYITYLPKRHCQTCQTALPPHHHIPAFTCNMNYKDF